MIKSKKNTLAIADKALPNVKLIKKEKVVNLNIDDSTINLINMFSVRCKAIVLCDMVSLIRNTISEHNSYLFTDKEYDLLSNYFDKVIKDNKSNIIINTDDSDNEEIDLLLEYGIDNVVNVNERDFITIKKDIINAMVEYSIDMAKTLSMLIVDKIIIKKVKK